MKILTSFSMDPFMTPPPRKHRFADKGMKSFHKEEVIYFIQSISFESIQVPVEMTTSTDEDLTIAFMHAFCDALADVLVKAVPSRSSPKKLVEQIKSPQMDTPTKTPPKPDLPGLVKSQGLKEKLALIPSLYGSTPTGKRTGMAPYAHLLINKGTKPSGSRRRRIEYPVKDSPIKPIPEHVAQAFAKDTAFVLKKSKGPYTLRPLYEHENDPLPFLWINAVVHPYTLSDEFTASMRRYNETISVNVDAMYDYGNSVTRICGDIVGFHLNSGDNESCILTFTYFHTFIFDHKCVVSLMLPSSFAHLLNLFVVRISLKGAKMWILFWDKRSMTCEFC
jgi:hypothetical protein